MELHQPLLQLMGDIEINFGSEVDTIWIHESLLNRIFSRFKALNKPVTRQALQGLDMLAFIKETTNKLGEIDEHVYYWVPKDHIIDTILFQNDINPMYKLYKFFGKIHIYDGYNVDLCIDEIVKYYNFKENKK